MHKTSPEYGIRTRKFPEIIVFDVDGVLVDVHESFHETVLQTVRHFTGKRVTHKQLHEWKNRPGYNDDWKLSTAWVQSLGGKQEYDEVKQKFLEIYWGSNGDGLVKREKWLFAPPSLKRLSKKAELGIFTGRVWDEMNHTLDRCKTREYFRTIVTAQDVSHTKPDPEGLLKVLAGRPPESAVYLGDNVDDALAAKSAGVPFVGILRRRSDERRERIDTLKELGALTILGHVDELEPWLTARQNR
ncbi:MAG TPA: HAD-IA family hydrolase [Candidatus Acidoferrales bacterium]